MGDVNSELKKARNAIREAEELSKRGLFDGAASRLYFAAYHAARASIWKSNPEANPKTHKGVAILYAREVVRPGRAPEEFAVLLSRLETERERADYGGTPASRDILRDEADRVRRMVRHAKGLKPG